MKDSVPSQSSQKASKAFVGSASREPDYEVVETTETKEEIKSLSVSSIKSMQGLFSGKKAYPIRLSSSITGLNAGSGVATLLALWNPISIAEFVDFAVLFTEYRVTEHILELWIGPQATTSSPTTMVTGSDPAGRISSITSINVANLSDVKKWNPQSTDKTVIRHTSKSGQLNAAVQSTPLTRDGWQLTSDAWGGQTVLFCNAPGAGTATAVYYQQTWLIEFRCRV